MKIKKGAADNNSPLFEFIICMRMRKTKILIPWLLTALLMLAAACSTQKNTPKTRFWHSFNAKYNTYYNGTLAYIDGSLEKENGNKDNYTEMIPLYTVGNKNSRQLGKGNFDRAIEKCQKAIKHHSIKRRPEWNKSRRKTEKDIEWLSRKEYNPFLWKAWLLMGRSQFYQGSFDEAAATFNYMSRLYQTQPAIYGRARAWLAKCYVEQEWLYDAEDVIRNIQRDTIHWRAQKEWDYTLADYYIHTGDYAQAIPYLRKVIKHEMRRKQKAREWFLMGQLQTAVGNRQEAYKAYRRVTRLNPPYELDFNARIAMTEVMAAGQWKKMIGRLKRMAKSDNNKDYLDQVYYAIGNIYLAQGDTASAIGAYEKGNVKATRSGIEKGVLLLKLGDIYWQQEKFSDAQRCYGEAIGLLDKERKDYEELSRRSKILDELAPHTDVVHLQDSLQALAKMDEKDRNAAIDRVIEALKKKEKEERNKLAEEQAQKTLQRNNAVGDRNSNNLAQKNANNTGGMSNGKWYFYNPMAVQQGKQAFERQWGKRENVDNWQRINQTVVAGLGEEQQENLTEEQRDSIAMVEAQRDSLEQQKTDSAQFDPHRREYYLAQIPFEEDQLAASNMLLSEGLYHSGVIFKDKLDNLPLGEKALRRLADNFPDFENMDQVYYHLYLLYARKGDFTTADTYVEQLSENFPESQWTQILTDPYFVENAKFGVHVEDSLYGATYNAFKANRFDEIKTNTQISESRFPLGANRDKFIFIGGLGKLNDGDGDGCLEDMNTLVSKFPQSKLAEMAGMIINGVKAGKRLHGGKFDLGDVWSRRSVVLNDSDSIASRQFSPDRNANFLFMVVYKPDSVNEHQLLYELARYNFTSYMVRNFDIVLEENEGLHSMQVTGFRNYDEALQYARQLYQQESIVRRLGNSRSIVISEPNLPLLGKQLSYDDYDAFYKENFAPLTISPLPLLSEPADFKYDPEDVAPAEQNPVESGDYQENFGEVIPNEETETIVPVEEVETIVPTEEVETIVPTEEVETVIPAEETETVVPVEETETVIPVEETETIVPVEETETVVPVEETKTVVPVEETKTVVPVEETETIVPVEEKKEEPVKEDDDALIIPDEEDTDNEEEEIYFEEEEDLIPVNTKQSKKQESYDLEDEYYELDGF